MSRCPAPSGKQFILHLGDQTATVTEVGATLRSCTAADTELLDGFGPDAMCRDARGNTFIPWPSRIEDGRYVSDGQEQQLPLTEPAAGNAVHGLTRWAEWRLIDHTPQRMRLQHVLRLQPGYPHQLRCELTCALRGSGLRVETTVTNLGSTPCPYGTGAQPYLALGTELVDDLSVCVPAGTWLLTDDRGIPTGRRTVDGTDRDLRRPGRLGDRVLDTAFTDLSRDADGGATIVVRAPTRREVELWMDASYGFVALSTGDSLPEPDRRRHGLGVEPMTAAPNAFRTGDGLATVAPGGSHSAVWELRPRWL